MTTNDGESREHHAKKNICQWLEIVTQGKQESGDKINEHCYAQKRQT